MNVTEDRLKNALVSFVVRPYHPIYAQDLVTQRQIDHLFKVLWRVVSYKRTAWWSK